MTKDNTVTYLTFIKPVVMQLAKLCRDFEIPYIAAFQLNEEGNMEHLGHSLYMTADSSETLHRCAEILDAQRIESVH